MGKNHTEKSIDLVLMTAILILLFVGAVMVYSSSSIWAGYQFNDEFFYLKRQILFIGFGLFAIWFTMKVSYHHWLRFSLWIYLLCLLLLIAVLIPGVGLVRGGAQSWIGVGAFSIQPSEFIENWLLFCMHRYFLKSKRKLKHFTKGFRRFYCSLWSLLGLMMLQPDLGTGLVFHLYRDFHDFYFRS